MKPTYSGYEGKRSRGGVQLPPVGQYEAVIQAVKTEKSYSGDRDEIIMMIEITEGEYKDQYHKVFEDQKERYGGDVKYKGSFKLRPPIDGDDPWIKKVFEGNLWCVEQSNPGYAWDWDEKKLVGKKIGINVRERLYTGNDGSDRSTTEIGQFEPIDDVRNGKCKEMKVRDGRRSDSSAPASTTGEGFTDVSAVVEVPF